MDETSYKVSEWGDKQREQWVEEVETGLDEVERSGEKLNGETLRKIGRAANIAVEMEELTKEVEDEVVKNENPNEGYEKFMAGREELSESLED